MKNRMYFSIFSVGLAILSLISGCTKKDDVSTGFLFKVKKDGYVTKELLYNQNNLIAEVNSPSLYRKFYYDQNLKLIKEENAVNHDSHEYDKFIDPQKIGISWLHLYEYDSNGKLTRLLSYNINNSGSYLYSTKSFEYNNEGLISKESFQFNEELVSQIKTYQYDSNGNVREEEIWVGEFHQKSTFEYDSFFNPYIVFKQTGSPGINTNKNNIIKIITFDYNPAPGLDSISASQVSYEYNNETMYPTKVIKGEEFLYY